MFINGVVKTIKTNVYKNKKSHNEYQKSDSKPKTWQMDGKRHINVMSANRHSKIL